MSHPTYVGFLLSRMDYIKPKEEPFNNIDLSEVTIKEEIEQHDYDIEHFENITYNNKYEGAGNQRLIEEATIDSDSIQALPIFLDCTENSSQSSSNEDSIVSQEVNAFTQTNTKQKRTYKNVQCPICNKEYSVKYIKIHIQTHSENDKPQSKRVQCEVCNVTICDKTLPGHLRIHTGEKPFVCSTCGKQFRCADQLKQHEDAHSGSRPYECSICHKGYARKSYLTQHARIHSGVKLYVCEHCGKKFTFKASYDIHIKVHTNDKRFICTLCEKKCISSSQLKTHMVKHTKERKHECAACGFKFGLPSHLRTHVTNYCKGAPKADVYKNSDTLKE